MLVSNPELPSTQLIPGATVFQISGDGPFEIFPIDAQAETSLKTEVELPQAPLTPNLDEAAVLLDKATNDELDALSSRTIREMRNHISDSETKLDKAADAISRAAKAGELDWAHYDEIKYQLKVASRSDTSALIDLNSTSLAGDAKKKAARDEVRKAIKAKDAALHLILAAKALRRSGGEVPADIVLPLRARLQPPGSG